MRAVVTQYVIQKHVGYVSLGEYSRDTGVKCGLGPGGDAASKLLCSHCCFEPSPNTISEY